MVSAILITSIIVAAIAVGLGAAYMAGMLDQVIEQIGIYLFKAEAKAEKKKLEAQGLKEGEDFAEGDLKGNKKANDVMQGGIGELQGKMGL